MKIPRIGLQARGEGGVREGRGEGGHHPTFRVIEHLAPAQLALAFGRAHAAEGEQARQPPIARAIGGPGQVARTIIEHQARAHHETQADILRRDMSTYDTGEAVGVADTDAGMTERRGRRHHLGGVGGAIEAA